MHTQRLGWQIDSTTIYSQQHGLHAELDAEVVRRRRLRPLGVIARSATQRHVQLKGPAASATGAGKRGRFERARNDEKLLDERPLPAGRVCLRTQSQGITTQIAINFV